jgi:preprotein translocase subunit SecA
MIALQSLIGNPADRSDQTHQKLRQLSRRGWIESIIAEAKQVARSLRDEPAPCLQAHTHKLCQFAKQRTQMPDPQLLALAGGAVYESIRQTLGLDLFDVQLHAGIAISCGAVAEMQTGEGKTLAGVLPAYVHALQGRGVHVATTNTYLANRDYQELSPVFRRLGMTTGILRDDASTEQTQAAYHADVTYGTGHAFGFDFLRDQLLLSQQESRGLGAGVYDRVSGHAAETNMRQRPLYAAIVDEIDHVLIDDAVSPLILSSSSKGEAPDAEIHRSARTLANKLTAGRDYQLHRQRRSAELTDHGFRLVYDDQPMATHPKLLRTWHEYVVLALRATHCFQRDAQYVVVNDEVQIVDESTGRIFADRTWSDGLHQAIQAAEGLPITPESSALARITRQRFYRHYQSIGGMTGTATGCEKEFASVYGLAVCVVPLRTPSQRRLEPLRCCDCEQSKIKAIAEETKKLHTTGRAVLIGTLSIAQSQAIATELEHRQLPFQLLNGVQDAEEAAIIAQAGRCGAITVATNLAGRGTDIKLQPRVRELGGLHVIVTEHHSLSRVDRQLIGRCARCGDPGSARVYLSPSDELFAKQAPWLGRAIGRSANGHTESPAFHQQVRRAQREMQSQAAALRWQLLKLDRDNESLLSRTNDLSGCWQL